MTRVGMILGSPMCADQSLLFGTLFKMILCEQIATVFSVPSRLCKKNYVLRVTSYSESVGLADGIELGV